MLRNTFLHIQGIGPVTERRFWGRGLRTWEEALASAAAARWHPDLAESCRRQATEDWRWFDLALPSAGKWRTYADFPGRALYVDIETDGGASGSSITVIGTYDGQQAKSFVRGENLEAAQAEIEAYPLVVTFNGAQFDLPVIRDRFRYNFFNFIHVDLRFPLNRLGYKGGLKPIEAQLGIERSEATRGLGGWDAVRLWQEHERGSREALELLLAYNREDVVNLKPLMEVTFERMKGRLDGWTAG